MLRRAALQEHEARAHGDGDERALRAVAGVEEEDHRASLAPAAAAVARVDDETCFWARGRLFGAQRSPCGCVLSQPWAARGARRGSDALFVVVTSSWEVCAGAFSLPTLSSVSELLLLRQSCSGEAGLEAYSSRIAALKLDLHRAFHT